MVADMKRRGQMFAGYVDKEGKGLSGCTRRMIGRMLGIPNCQTGRDDNSMRIESHFSELAIKKFPSTK